MSLPLKKRPWSGDPDDAGARKRLLLAPEEGSAFDVEEEEGGEEQVEDEEEEHLDSDVDELEQEIDYAD